MGGNPIAQGVCVLSAGFELDPRLDADTILAKSLGHCELLVMNDARFPWAILVPRISGARELHDLNPETVQHIWSEVLMVSAAIGRFRRVTKVNIGALGNVVSQLHIHVVGRHPADLSWPDPVWGHTPRVRYEDGAERELIAHLVDAMA